MMSWLFFKLLIIVHLQLAKTLSEKKSHKYSTLFPILTILLFLKRETINPRD